MKTCTGRSREWSWTVEWARYKSSCIVLEYVICTIRHYQWPSVLGELNNSRTWRIVVKMLCISRSRDKTDHDVIRENHQFLWDNEGDDSNLDSWLVDVLIVAQVHIRSNEVWTDRFSQTEIHSSVVAWRLNWGNVCIVKLVDELCQVESPLQERVWIVC